MTNVKKIKILDCTLRDGGYYNKWDFDPLLVKKYLKSIGEAGIDVIELGFRSPPKQGFFGASLYTSDNYIDSLNIGKGIVVGVMIDASDILTSNIEPNELINLLFQKKSHSRVDLVRVAVNFSRVTHCYEIISTLNHLGYVVVLNIMQANFASDEELTEIARTVQEWGVVNVLYFADSLGSMDRVEVKRVTALLKSEWFGELGFHAHNNKGLGVSNSLAAIEYGVTWVDGTLLGMGRGAGNAQTENLLLEIQDRYLVDYRVDSLFELVLSDFTILKNHYLWGESLLYILAANYNIHPSYIQDMLTNERYSSREIIHAIDFMSSMDTRHYDKSLLLHAQGNSSNPGTWSVEGLFENREVLILGSGPGIFTYQSGILHYIKSRKPVVISLNISGSISEEWIDMYVSSNEYKMLSEFDRYCALVKPLVASKTLLSQVYPERMNEIGILYDYGLIVEKNTFIAGKKECTLPYEMSIGYALSLASAGGAKEISLVGFDGYSIGDSRQDRMNEILSLFFEKYNKNVVALTPTTYDVKLGSIYENRF